MSRTSHAAGKVASVPEDRRVGVRELRQNASNVLRDVETLGSVTVTVSGRPAATLSPWVAPEPVTVAQFDGLLGATPSADHRRYELIAGALNVSPSPDFGHQRISRDLMVVLHGVTALLDLETVATWSWLIDDINCPEPDLLVVPDKAARGPRLVGATPLLVVEVTSTNRVEDLGRKRALYARAGAPAYWVVDRGARVLLVHVLDPATMTYPDPVSHAEGVAHIPTPFGDVEIDATSLLSG